MYSYLIVLHSKYTKKTEKFIVKIVKSAFLSKKKKKSCYIYIVGHLRPRRCKKGKLLVSSSFFIVFKMCPVIPSGRLT